MNLTQVILGVVSTEKAERQKANRVYTLRVHAKATKIDVINSLRRYYNVEPSGVRIIKVRSKKRLVARGKSIQKRDPAKRALVTLRVKSKPFDISNFQA